MKKILSALLVAVMLMTVIPLSGTIKASAMEVVDGSFDYLADFILTYGEADFEDDISIINSFDESDYSYYNSISYISYSDSLLFYSQIDDLYEDSWSSVTMEIYKDDYGYESSSRFIYYGNADKATTTIYPDTYTYDTCLYYYFSDLSCYDDEYIDALCGYFDSHFAYAIEYWNSMLEYYTGISLGNFGFTKLFDAYYLPTFENIEAPVITATTVASTGKIKISWDAVDGAESYNIYRATSKNGTYKYMKNTTSLSYTNTSAVAGKKYYYVVEAVSYDGYVSADSNIVSATCKLASPSVTVSNISSTGKIKLEWNAVDGATSYKIYRSTSKNGTYSLIKTTSSLSFINTSAVAGKTYYYKIKAVNSTSTADSAYSSIITRTCDLPKPIDVKISLTSKGCPKITWSAVDGATAYRVYRSTSKDGTYTLMKTTSSTSYTNTSATRGKTYYYKVRAICNNSAADSAQSSAISIYVR